MRWRSVAWLRDLTDDIRYTCRGLRTAPAFTTVAVLTLALGIGATTAISAVVDAVLIRPLPFPDSDRLVRLIEHIPHVVAGRPPLERGLTRPEFLEWRTSTKALSDAAVLTWLGASVRTQDGMARLTGAMVSPNLFALLGTRPALGRVIDASDDRQPDVVVLSDEAWRRRFRADPAIVGTSVPMRLTEQPQPRAVTIIGVLPAGFEFPTGAVAEFFRPYLLDATYNQYSSDVIGRLAPGVSLQAANEEVNVSGQAIPPRRAGAPPLGVPRFEVQRLKDRIVQPSAPVLRVFLGAVILVLLIVCANVANLILLRASGRQRELAVRFALGASRGRVVRQVFTEAAVLSGLGVVAGAAVGAAAVALVKSLASIEAPGMFRFAFASSLLPRVTEIAVDFRLFAMAIVIAAVTCAIVSVAPALHAARVSHLEAMGTRGGGTRRAVSRVRAALVAAQLALATVLLVGAGLLTQTFIRMSAVDRGYDPGHVLAFHIVMPTDYSTDRKVETIEHVLSRLRATPGIVAAGFTRAGMLIREEIFVGTFVPPGRTPAELRADPARPRVRPVSPGFLSAMGVPLVAGQEFSLDDARERTHPVVISRSVAQQFFGTANAVGRTLDWHVTDTAIVPATVIGVAEDIHNDAPDRPAAAEIFVDYRQLATVLQPVHMSTARRDNTAFGILSFAVRTTDAPEGMAPRVSAVVRSADPDVGVDAILPMDRLVAGSMARPRFSMVLLAVFAGLAAILAAIGIYGVLAYAVAQRVREIGIRMALGARRGHVMRTIMADGARLTLIGLSSGLLAAAASVRLLDGMLFGIAALDVTTFVLVAAGLGVVALAACYVPARRASTIDPAVTMRTE